LLEDNLSPAIGLLMEKIGDLMQLGISEALKK
jgi:hypothetical protein